MIAPAWLLRSTATSGGNVGAGDWDVVDIDVVLEMTDVVVGGRQASDGEATNVEALDVRLQGLD